MSVTLSKLLPQRISSHATELLAKSEKASESKATSSPLSVLPPVMVRAQVDAGRIHQVVTNLLNNAIKFTPRGGRASVLVNVDGTHFLIKVQDTGCGIGPELQPRIFDMFTQADGTDSSRGRGLGIGLAVVKELVSLHGGTIEVKSEGRGRGSEFIARLPLLRQTSRATN